MNVMTVLLFYFFFFYFSCCHPMIFHNFVIHFPTLQLKKGAVSINCDVGARISTLISVSDGLGPSIFCRKIERMRPMREAVDGKVFVSR